MNHKKLAELDVLSGIAIIFVVLMHCNAFYAFNVINISYTDFHLDITLLDNFIHGAVPIFIFVAGYKYALNNLHEKYTSFVYKKIKQVIKPFLVISLLLILKEIIVLREYDLLIAIKKFLYIFIGHNIAYQLWYIPLYLFIMISYPLIYKIFKNTLLRILFIILTIFIQKSLGTIYIIFNDFPFSFVYYYLFFEMGILFCKYNIKDIIQKFDFIIIILYVVITIHLTIFSFTTYYELIKSFILWPLSVTSYYLLSIRLKNSKLLKYIGQKSFYIFLLHEPIICTNISAFIKDMGYYTSFRIVFLAFFLTMLFTLLFYQIINKTFLKYIFFNVNKTVI